MVLISDQEAVVLMGGLLLSDSSQVFCLAFWLFSFIPRLLPPCFSSVLLEDEFLFWSTEPGGGVWVEVMPFSCAGLSGDKGLVLVFDWSSLLAFSYVWSPWPFERLEVCVLWTWQSGGRTWGVSVRFTQCPSRFLVCSSCRRWIMIETWRAQDTLIVPERIWTTAQFYRNQTVNQGLGKTKPWWTWWKRGFFRLFIKKLVLVRNVSIHSTHNMILIS